MPARLRPTNAFAADAILVGDPGRALALAQALLTKPQMSNHARGLWGYSGETPGGRRLTVQSTGMGGPSAALVLGDLAELGVRRAVRVGTCVAIAPEPVPGELLVVLEAHAWSGGGGGRAVLPDDELTAAVRRQLDAGGGGDSQPVAEGDALPATIASLDFLHPGGGEPGEYAERVDAADMQTAALLLRGQELGIALAAVLIVAESAGGEQANDETLAAAAERAGRAAATALSVRT